MKEKTFDEIVKARANERTQAKIKAFKEAVKKSCFELTGKTWLGYDQNKVLVPDFRAVLSILSSENHTTGWPSSLWEKEEDHVREELLKTMDEMQRALLAASKAEPGENTQAELKEG